MQPTSGSVPTAEFRQKTSAMHTLPYEPSGASQFGRAGSAHPGSALPSELSFRHSMQAVPATPSALLHMGAAAVQPSSPAIGLSGQMQQVQHALHGGLLAPKRRGKGKKRKKSPKSGAERTAKYEQKKLTR